MSIFRAYDIRGIYPEELNEDTAYKIGRAFVTFLNIKEVVIGRDARLSSPQLFTALVKGITNQGANVIDVGVCSTPMFYFGSKDAKSSIMVTASHNPKEYNGFKLCRANAVPISELDGIKDVEKLVQENKFINVKSKGGIKEKEIMQDFIDLNLSFVKTDKKFKIVLDSANGMCGLTLPKIFKKLENVELIELYTDIDFSFPNHEANPMNPENLIDIQNRVKSTGADFGICTDGDGDRCVFIDEKGNAIPSDILTALIAKSLLKERKGLTVLYDLRSSKVVKEIVEENGGKASLCRVGHSFIKKQMRDEDATFAGELSGHMYFKEHNFTESSFIPVAYIMNLLSEEEKPISELIKPLMRYCQSGEINSEVADKDSKLAEIEVKYKEHAKEIKHLDGLSMYFDGWWFNLRKSNTEPLLRLNLEADKKELMESKRDELLNLIRA